MKTPSGRPASFHSSASQTAADGSFSLGLSTTVLPAAMATGKNHIGTMAGKLNGEMIPTTPSGSRLECTSTPVETPSEWPPFSRWEIPHANSTTSWPRAISPIASDRTLPCSAVMSAASSPLRELSSSRNANITCVRAASDVRPQAGAAAAAAAMTASASARDASASRPVTSPVAGLVTSAVRSLVPAKASPPAQWPMCFVVVMSSFSRQLVRGSCSGSACSRMPQGLP